MKGERNLSDFWRHDGSDDPVRELVSILQGADILIGNMGSDLQVAWSSRDVSYTDLARRIVALDYGPLRDQACPFQGTSVDEVVGYAAHEGGHCLWSLPGKEERLRHEIRASWSTLPRALQDDWQTDEDAMLAEVCRIQNVLEDAYIDHHIAQKWPVLGEYVRISRGKLFERVPFDLCAAAEAPNPDRNAAINLWVSVSLYRYSLPPNASTPVKQALDRLVDLSQRAKDEEEPALRQTMAAQAAIVLWQSFPVKEAPLPLKTPGQGGSEASRRR